MKPALSWISPVIGFWVISNLLVGCKDHFDFGVYHTKCSLLLLSVSPAVLPWRPRLKELWAVCVPASVWGKMEETYSKIHNEHMKMGL